jgi:Flp pilus assembly protein TadB
VSLALVILAGAGLGLGVVIVVASLRPARPGLSEVLLRIYTPRALAVPASDRRSRLLVALGTAVGIDRLVTDTARRDLHILDRSVDDHIARSVASGLGLGALSVVASALLAFYGLGIPLLLPAGLTVIFAVAGALLPTLVLHQEAEKRRQSFKHALGAYFNLVGVNVAAGRGVEGALEKAAETGQGPAFAAIRRALYRAKVTGQTPWAGLDQLGRDMGIDELRELAATVSLAGGVGAKVRESLAAKAATLRRRGLDEVEADANSANERMSIPVLLLVVGFIIFVGYPAVERVLTSLH